MSLYGALYSSVAGLQAQSNKVGVISDNISNVNTVGYKQTSAAFESLVISSGEVRAYSPGGVLTQNSTGVSEQGLIQGTDTATDVAIAGSGFFVVKSGLEADAEVLYTRAGSFRQDSLGNFRNGAGYFLQGWPLDREGRLPGEPGNLNTNSINNISSLEVINILSATGSAAETTTVEISANLKASQAVYPGSGAAVPIDSLTVNENRPAKSIIVPGVLEGSAQTQNVNSLQRGDKFSITSGGGVTSTFRYGGFTYSRNVTSDAIGDNHLVLPQEALTLGEDPFTTSDTSSTVTVASGNHGLATGDVVTISGVSADVNGITAAQLNSSFVVTVVDKDTFTIVTAGTANADASGGGVGASLTNRPFSGNILDATTSTQRFLSVTGTTDFSESGLSFSITTETAGTVDFSYTNGTANAQLRQFNTLENLADAINSVSTFTARVVSGRLYVASSNANEAMTFANGATVAEAGPPIAAGINWVEELGLKDITLGTDRFHSLGSLSSLVNASIGLTSTLTNPLTEASLQINLEDPLDTIAFSDIDEGAALAAFTSATPFTTVNGSKVVTVTHPTAHGYSSGDVVTLDATNFADYPSAFSATNVFTTADGDATVNVAQVGHGFTSLDVVYIDPSSLSGYPLGDINGIPMTSLDGFFSVTRIDDDNFSFEAASIADTDGTAGAGSLTVSPTVNGIPLTDFTGQFTVSVSSPSTYTIEARHAATSAGSGGRAGLVVTTPGNNGSLLAELGMVDSLGGDAFTAQSLGPLGPEYDATDADKNIAGSGIVAQFNQNVRIYDSLGSPHDMKVSFIKIAVNTWAVEVYAADTSDVSSNFANGQVASGTLTFNGDGSLRSVTSGLANDIGISWVNGAEQSAISFDWGTPGEPFGTSGATAIGLTDGMAQFDADYRVNFVNQNGAAVGQLVSVSFTEEGFVVANYSNGESQSLYKIPLADFSDPDGLQAVSGNVYSQSANSGEANLREPGTNGAGKIQASALETSTVDLADQLTDLIVAQRAYQANTKLITTSDSLLEELNRTLT